MLRFNWRRVACAIVLPVFMGGCAGLMSPGSSKVPSDQAEPVRAYRDAINLSGRLSVRYQENDKDEAVHGNFTWNQTPDLTNIALLSPLGQTLAIIDVAPSASTLTQAGQPPRVADNVDALAAEALGWPLPISGLRNWLQGFVADAAGQPLVATPRTTGPASVTTADGWRIDYASWLPDETAPGQRRPKRIDLERYTAQAGNVSLRIVIDNWQPH